MEHNPFEPPKAEVGTGFEEPPPPRRTLSVWFALFLVGLYILQQLFIIKMLSRFYVAGGPNDLSMFLFGGRTLLWVAAFFAIMFGRNWGRVLLVLLTLYVAFSAFPRAWRLISNASGMPDPDARLTGFVSLLPCLVCAVAIYLLYGPGRHWFARHAAPG